MHVNINCTLITIKLYNTTPRMIPRGEKDNGSPSPITLRHVTDLLLNTINCKMVILMLNMGKQMGKSIRIVHWRNLDLLIGLI